MDDVKKDIEELKNIVAGARLKLQTELKAYALSALSHSIVSNDPQRNLYEKW